LSSNRTRMMQTDFRLSLYLST